MTVGGFVIWLNVAFAAPTAEQLDAAAWKALARADRSETGTVEVLTAQIDGVDCFRGVATASLSPSELMAVVLDLDTAARWSTTGVTESRVLERTPTTISYFQYLDLPGWTLSSDRYWFLKGEIRTTAERAELVWGPLPPDSPHLAERERFAAAHRDAIEPPLNVGSWRFDKVPAGTKITYSVCTQSGGSLPAAIQNAASRRTLPDNLADLIREARKR